MNSHEFRPSCTICKSSYRHTLSVDLSSQHGTPTLTNPLTIDCGTTVLNITIAPVISSSPTTSPSSKRKLPRCPYQPDYFVSRSPSYHSLHITTLDLKDWKTRYYPATTMQIEDRVLVIKSDREVQRKPAKLQIMREEAGNILGVLALYLWREVLMLPLSLLGIVQLLGWVFGLGKFVWA